MKKIFLFTSALALLLVGCSKNPITGKSPLKLVPNNQLFPMSFQQYDKTLKESKLIKGTKDAQMIKRVGANIQAAVEQYLSQKGQSKFLEGYKWEYELIDSDQINAWCMPGGKVAFYTGILPICEGETGVAVVMGHEITHALAEHGAQRISKQYIAAGVNIAGNIALQNNSKTRSIFTSLYPMASTATILAYSRKHELEADDIGLKIMAMAGYNPEEAPKFWTRMGKATAGGQRPPEFLSTHPSPEKRIASLKAKLPEVIPLYREAIAKK